LTTVDERSQAIAETAVDITFDLVDSGRRRQETITPQLVIREST
jgi:DNA-binding LacI/PurR family transcriptional regulator